MRWKLFLRRLSVSAPRVNVRSDLPWPLRWALLALTVGFSAAIALWAFEFGRDIAGLDRGAKDEIATLRAEVERLRDERDKAQAVANTAESLLKTAQASQDRLAQQLRQAEADAMALKADLGFFEKLLPAGASGLAVRGMQVEPKAPGQLRYQLLVMQSGRGTPEFRGRYELTLSGILDGRPWTQAQTGARSLTVKQYARVEGTIEHPPQAVVQTVELKVTDNHGVVRATQTVKP
jgi:hypothetical protein